MAASLFKYENQAKKNGYKYIIGVDEAGRGPLAGPIVAAAVFLNNSKFKNKIRDSKQLSFSQREKAMEEISQKAFFGVGIINEMVIDEINILKATYLAMNNAVMYLTQRLQQNLGGFKRSQRKVFVLIDGNRFESDMPFDYSLIVKGDRLSYSISCASIVAKVTRDRILKIYHQIYPQYGFEGHKGYPTLKHRLAIKKYGISKIHRKSFRAKNPD